MIHPFGDSKPEGWFKKIKEMKTLLKKSLILLMLFYGQSIVLKGNDSTNYSISLNYYMDLSDTYGGGNLFSGEFTISRSWYGEKMSFGHFQSQSTFLFQFPYEEVGQIIEIPVPEMSIMKIGAISGFIRPVQKKWITADLIFGAAFGKAQSLYLKEIEYEYSLIENKFTYLNKDYQLAKVNHLGYQVGVDISFYFSKRIGLQLNARIQDLSNGGTFFFVGTGLCFRL
jgi:hypothetical protein